MQEDGKRHIYEVNLGSGEFKQGACHLDVMAENFANATCFAASSQYYVIYYAYGNKVYAYNVGSGVSEPVITLEGEEITCLKFNRYVIRGASMTCVRNMTMKSKIYTETVKIN